MAWDLVWGGLAGNIPRIRAGLWLVSQDPALAGGGGARVEVGLWFGTPNTINYNGLSFNWSAQLADGSQFASGSGSFNTSGSNVSKEIARAVFNTPVDWRYPLDWHLRLRIPNPLGGGTAEVWLDGWSPYARPAVPSPATATLLTGPERARLQWPGNNDIGARITAIAIDRYSGPYGGGAGSWYRIATIGGDSTEMYDTSLEPGFGYKYRVRAENDRPQQESDWAETGWIDTTPLDASNITAVKAANAVDINVAWTNPPGWFGGRQSGKTEIYDLGTGTPVLVATLDGGPTTWTHVSPSASQPHRYNVRLATYGPPVLRSSDQVLSNTIVLITPPLAPAGIGPTVLDPAASPATAISWTHNPVDTTGQVAFSLRHRLAGGATWTTIPKTTSSASQWTPTWTYTRGQTIEVQVQTWGAHVDPSPWSATALVLLDGRPSATNLVGATLGGASLTAAHTYYDPEGTAQSAAVWRLRDATGAVLETVAIDGPGTQAAFRTRLANATTYLTDVKVRDGAGQWSLLAERTSAISYLPPAMPAVTVAWDSERAAGLITLSYVAPDPVTQVPTDTVEVWRDGVLVASVIAPDPGQQVTVIDPIPPVDSTVIYTVVAWSSTPSSAEVDVPLQPVQQVSRAWINAGTGWAAVASAGRFDRSEDITTAKVVEQYAGRAGLVETIGDAMTTTITVRASVATYAEVAAIMAAYTARTTVCYRDPHGRMFGSIDKVTSSSSSKLGPFAVGMTVVSVDYDEGGPVGG